MSAQQQQMVFQQLLQQLIDAFNQNIYSPFLVGVFVFMGFLWFFHEFREWRLSSAFLTALLLAGILMLAMNPLALTDLLAGP